MQIQVVFDIFYLAPSYVFSYLFKDKYEYPFRKSRNLVQGDHTCDCNSKAIFPFHIVGHQILNA